MIWAQKLAPENWPRTGPEGISDMTILVTDAGFCADDWRHGFTPLSDLSADSSARALAIELEPDADIDLLTGRLNEIGMIRVNFPGFADGRGFTLARLLRLRGFGGRMRASGHVISDQYAMARRAGFDEIEISKELAARQPEEEWAFRFNWREHDYQSRLAG